MVLNKDEGLWNGQPLARGRCSCGMAMTSPDMHQVRAWLESHGDRAGQHIGEFELI